MKGQNSSGVIPARWQSSRFPGKPLAMIKGKPMIQWVYEGASRSKELDNLFVATDDKRIEEAVLNFGGNAIMTTSHPQSGSERIFETLSHPDLVDSDIIVNIQGDEPLIKPELIDPLILFLKQNDSIPVATACTSMQEKELNNPNIVKVVSGKLINKENKIDIALYFSRSPIPYARNKPDNRNPYLRHIGVYAYKKRALEDYFTLGPSVLEQTESLEQLRMLEAGWRIGLIFTDYEAVGVDTAEDIPHVEKLLSKIE